MGCHTWIYKKVSSLSKEELNAFLKKEINREFKIWKDAQTLKKSILEQVEFFYNDGNASCQDFINIMKEIDDGVHLTNYKDEWYYLISVDEKFKCTICHNEPIDTIDKMLTYLNKCPHDAINYYVKDTSSQEPNKFSVIKGLSYEITHHMLELYRHNDVFVEFI